MTRTVALIAAIIAACVLACGASRTPAPAPADAPATSFSAARAFEDVLAIGARPHPLGSAEHDRVRDRLLGRCRDLGMEAVIDPGLAIDRDVFPSEIFVQGGDVENVVCTLPGRDRALPALALMAHYDTVPSSPGAADDSAGVAVALETVRALKSQGAPLRDVMLLLTDGEEAGLLGARVLFTADGLARRVGVVLNMEAHGGGGRAYMFETGDHDAGMVDLFRRTAVNPTAASLSGYVYALMPAGTDFTVARTHGVAGLNFAFEDEPFDYHAASSTPAVLDQGSLQHLGDQVLSTARAVAWSARLPNRGPDVVYADLLGGPIVVYPVWAGWLVLAAVAGGLIASFRRAFQDERFSWFSAVRGAAALVLTVAAAGFMLELIREGTGADFGLVEEKPLAARFPLYEAALAAGCLGVMTTTFLIVGWGRSKLWSAFAGACVVGLAAAVALQVAAPVTAYLMAWPLAIAAVAAAALAFRWRGEARSGSAAAFVAALAALPLAQLLYTAHPVALSIGTELPETFAVLTALAALMLFPLLWPAGRNRFSWALGLLALLIAIVVTLVLRLSDPWSPRHPRPEEAVYVADLDHGRFLRASPLAELDGWTRTVLTADGAPIREQPLQPFARRAYVAPGWPVTIGRPDLLETWSKGSVTLKLTPGGAARELYLEFSPTTPISSVTINGLVAAESLQAGQWAILRWTAPRRPLVVVFKAPRHLELAARYAQIVDGWPADARRLPPMPADAMTWGDGAATVLLGSTRYRW